MKNEVAQRSLGHACRHGNAVKAQEAIDAGADANADVFNWREGTLGGSATAAYVAAGRGHIAVLDVLLPAPVSADPDKGNARTGATPCLVACANDHPEAVAVLLEHGADPNSTDNEGATPCMMAVKYYDGAPALRALAEGAARQDRALEVNALGTGGWEGKTALDIALNQNRAEAAAYLRDELGALRGKAVRRRRVCRLAIRVLLQYKLHRRAKQWLVERLAAAKARVDFAPGGAGADQAAASFAVAAAVPAQAPPPPPIDDDSCDEPPAKRARTE